jgi:hypothetical protein
LNNGNAAPVGAREAAFLRGGGANVAWGMGGVKMLRSEKVSSWLGRLRAMREVGDVACDG